ncbi:MAG: terminase [Bradyrhizobiaceae bacterium]|nr:MAG: terminase [Bradyrhizobiaceae bacterium]
MAGSAAAATDGPLETIWQAQPGPQQSLISCPVFEVFFGGARGGGKTDGVLGDFLEHADAYGEHAIGLMIRRQRTELIETIERSKAIYAPLGWKFHEQDKMWRAPDGARLRFAYLERDADAEAYQGHSYTRVYVEEIGNFPSDRPILKLLATLRSGAGVPVGFRATGNPGGPGHQWVRARYIDPAPAGYSIIKDQLSGLERVYIPSRVGDNKYLGGDYVAQLRASGSVELVKAWLDGDWSVIEGAFFDCWESSRHVIRPFEIPKDWTRFRSGDWGSASPFSFGWWAIAGDDYQTDGGPLLPRGCLVRYREWYGCQRGKPNVGLRLTAEQVGLGLAERAGDEQFAYGVLDPSAFREDGGPSIHERMMLASGQNGRGGYKVVFRPADNARVPGKGAMGGWDQMRSRMIGDLNGHPMIVCFNNCVDSIRTIPVLQHDTSRPEDLDTDMEDHAADDWRYACMSRPWLKPMVDSEKRNETGYAPLEDDPATDEWMTY